MNADTIERLTTERENPASADIDRKTSLEIVRIINAEDAKVAPAVARALPEIALMVDDIVAAFRRGGRLLYIGAGTSGRLGVLDASECPPTYGVEPGMVRGIIAGGEAALTRSVESAEDRREEGARDLERAGLTAADAVVGVTASGAAPYVLGALEYARARGAATGAISCNRDAPVFALAARRILLEVGPEVVAGSTRMKSGTAQKMVLNMLSTAAMIRLGKVYRNLMVDVRPVNHKLVLRSLRLIREVTGCSREEAERAFEASGGAGGMKSPKVAIVMVLLGVNREEALTRLAQANGRIGDIPH